MFRTIVTLVLLVCVICQEQVDDEEKLESCSALGDPHVIRFPSEQNEKVAEVWCQQSGLQTLLKNKYVNANIRVSPKPYVITEFNLAFYDDNGDVVCTVNQYEFSLPSRSCGEDITITKDGNILTIVDKIHSITFTIQHFDYKNLVSDHFYYITTLQPAYLIPDSKGLCKTSCDPDSGVTLSRPKRASSAKAADSSQNLIQKSAEKICELSISKLVPEFKITSLRQMNMETKNAYSACLTDVRLTGDIMFAKASVASLAVNLATKNLPAKSDTQKILNKVYALFKETSASIDSALSEFVKSPTTTTTTTPTPAPSKDDHTVVFDEDKAGSLSCRDTYSAVIKILSATYQSVSTSCSMDATARLKEICAHSPRLCKFNASNTDLRKNPCVGEAKQLKVHYQCVSQS